MQIDLLWLHRQFDRFNSQYFAGKLPTPRLSTGHSRTQLGSMTCKRKSNTGEYYDFTIRLSNYYDQSEHSFQSVLLHEMIHYYIAHKGIKDSSPHGVVFRKMMNLLNRDGWGINVSAKTKNMDNIRPAVRNSAVRYLILAIEMSDGRRLLSSVSPRSALRINKALQTIRQVDRFSWYTTRDPWFEDMPKVRTLRGRCVNADLYNEKVKSMTPFVMPTHTNNHHSKLK